MDISLSDNDINNFLNAVGCYRSIILYGDIKRGGVMQCVRDWKDGKRYPIVINYLTSAGYGHWVCLFENSEGVNFFDSYGGEPDSHLDWNLSPEFRKRVGEDRAYLCDFILGLSGVKKVTYNDFKYQARGEGITTCGRWICFRLLERELGCAQFKKLVLDNCARLGISKDELAVRVTDEFL